MKIFAFTFMVAAESLSFIGVAHAQRIGYVNMQEIMASMPESAQADTAIKKYQQQLDQQYQAMQEEFQDEASSFVKDSATMTDAVKEVKRMSLQDLNNHMLQLRQGMNQEISQKYNELQKPIIDKIQTAVRAVAKDKGYSYVMKEYVSGGSGPVEVFVVKPAGDDLTMVVKKQLGIK
jgi:outer membrane protein